MSPQRLIEINFQKKEPKSVTQFSAKKALDVKVSSLEGDKDEKETVLDNTLQLDEAVKKVSDFLSAQNRDLLFNIDEQTQRTVVTVKESSSGEVIRQIPSEEVLKLANRIQELQQDVGNSIGIFINSEI